MSGHGPVFHAGEFRDCGFWGVDDGRYFQNRLSQPQETGPEHDPLYSGEVMTIHRETMITATVGYEQGNAKYIVISSGFGGGGTKLKVVDDLPEGMGIIESRFEINESDRHLAVVFETPDGNEWGRDDVTRLLAEQGVKTDPEWLAELFNTIETN